MGRQRDVFIQFFTIAVSKLGLYPQKKNTTTDIFIFVNLYTYISPKTLTIWPKRVVCLNCAKSFFAGNVDQIDLRNKGCYYPISIFILVILLLAKNLVLHDTATGVVQQELENNRFLKAELEEKARNFFG